MREVILPASRYLCHIYEIKDDDEFRKALQEMTAVKEYGENVKLPDGTVLHNNYDDENYIAPYGERKLLRCRKCGALLIQQETIDPNIYDGWEFQTDWLPVASTEEADLLNILLDGAEFSECTIRHLRKYNRSFRMTKDEEPKPNNEEELRQKIKEKYANTDPEFLEKLIKG